MTKVRIPLAQQLTTLDGSSTTGVPTSGSCVLNGVIEKNASVNPSPQAQVRRRKPMIWTTNGVVFYNTSGVAMTVVSFFLSTQPVPSTYSTGPDQYYCCWVDTSGNLWAGIYSAGTVGGSTTTAINLGVYSFSGIPQKYTGGFCFYYQNNLYVYGIGPAAPLNYTVNVSVSPWTSTTGANAVDRPVAYEYFDNYIVWAGALGATVAYGQTALFNSNFQDWALANSFSANYQQTQDQGGFTALAANGNYLLAATNVAIYFYYDAGNPVGSVLGLYKEATLPFGTYQFAKSRYGVAFVAATPSETEVYFVPYNSVQATKISTPDIEKLIPGQNICFVTQYGRPFIFVWRTNSNAVYVYDITAQIWCPYDFGTVLLGVPLIQTHTTQNTDGSTINDIIMLNNKMRINDEQIASTSAVWVDTIDNATNPYLTLSQVFLMDGATSEYKFYASAQVIGKRMPASTPVTIQYSDDGGATYSSSSRKVDMTNIRPITYQLGRSMDRIWQVSYSGSYDVQLTALEVDVD